MKHFVKLQPERINARYQTLNAWFKWLSSDKYLGFLIWNDSKYADPEFQIHRLGGDGKYHPITKAGLVRRYYRFGYENIDAEKVDEFWDYATMDAVSQLLNFKDLKSSWKWKVSHYQEKVKKTKRGKRYFSEHPHHWHAWGTALFKPSGQARHYRIYDEDGNWEWQEDIHGNPMVKDVARIGVSCSAEVLSFLPIVKDKCEGCIGSLGCDWPCRRIPSGILPFVDEARKRGSVNQTEKDWQERTASHRIPKEVINDQKEEASAIRS